MQSKFDKTFLVFEIIGFEFVAINCPYYYENTYRWKSVSSEAVLNCQVWLEMTFSNSGWVRMGSFAFKIVKI